VSKLVALVARRLRAALPEHSANSSMFRQAGTFLPMPSYERQAWQLQSELLPALILPLKPTVH
jgi:hypothetical protein